MSNYNPHDHFDFRKIVLAPDEGFGGYHEPDGEYDFRAMVAYVAPDFNGNKVLTTAMFPPSQLKTTDSKYDFNRHLNLYLDDLKTRVGSITNVVVSQGGNTIYSFQP